MKWFLLCCFALISIAADVIPEKNKYGVEMDYFRSPLDIELNLSGNFAELRTNHFHAGLDIRTQQKQGLPVYAIADGYVSRIKVSPYGYGNALYIMHTNGYTSTYGHLRNFNPAIAEYTRVYQQRKKKFAVEIYPETSEFRVKKGDIIAYSGNSGSSAGPHLHFEIRDPQQAPINPYYFGIEVPDEAAPVLKQLAIYTQDKTRFYNDAHLVNLKKLNTSYVPSSKVIKVNSKRIGLGIEAIDKITGSSNIFGVHSIKVLFDGQPIYHYQADKVPFHLSRAMNSHIDYKLEVKQRKRLHKCFVAPGNALPVYKELKNRGIIELRDAKPHKVIIQVSDFHGNRTFTSVDIQYSPVASVFKQNPTWHQKQKLYYQRFRHDKNNSYFADDFQVQIPKGVLFDTLYLDYTTQPNKEAHVFSDIHKLDHGYEPVLKYFDVAVKPTNLPDELKSKAVVAVRDVKNKVHCLGGKFEGELLKARTRRFGSYFITTDSKKPSISAINISNGKNMKGLPFMRFKATDNLSGIKRYKLLIDGVWQLIEYDAKYNRFTHYFDGKLKAGKHSVMFEVVDKCNNKAVYRTNFVL